MTPADPYALDCPCRCHGSTRACNHAGGCGHLHRDIDRRRPACHACARPSTDRLCSTCAGVLADALASVPELLDELFTARTGQDRLGRAGGRPSSDEQPLGYRPAALEATERLTIVLGYWAAHYGGELDAPAGIAPANDPRACAAWLGVALPEITAGLDLVGDFFDQIRAVVRIAWRVVDRPAPRCYAGPCDCGADLYGDPTAPRLRCGGCGATFATGDRRAFVLDALREHLATAAEIAAGVGELYGEQINRKRINQWHHRGRLAERGVTLGAADPLFRIGDVLELAAASAAVRHRPQPSPIGMRHPAEPTSRRRGVSPSPR